MNRRGWIAALLLIVAFVALDWFVRRELDRYVGP